MKNSKIISILIIFCICTTFIGLVSATEEIGGVKFNIPDGYKENVEEADISENSNNTTYTKYFYNQKEEGIAITVMTSDENLTIPTDIPEGAVNRTINGVEGLYLEQDNLFGYEMDGKLVEIATTDKDLLEQIIVNNTES